jgi:hypothetical protein
VIHIGQLVYGNFGCSHLHFLKPARIEKMLYCNTARIA